MVLLFPILIHAVFTAYLLCVYLYSSMASPCVFYTPVMVNSLSSYYGRSYRPGTRLVALFCTFSIKVTSLANQVAQMVWPYSRWGRTSDLCEALTRFSVSVSPTN